MNEKNLNILNKTMNIVNDINDFNLAFSNDNDSKNV